MNTRRFPRTLQEAFGPHTDSRLHPKPLTPEERAAQANRELVAATVLCALVGIVGMFIVFSGASS